jgi:hypothetical protein
MLKNTAINFESCIGYQWWQMSSLPSTSIKQFCLSRPIRRANYPAEKTFLPGCKENGQMEFPNTLYLSSTFQLPACHVNLPTRQHRVRYWRYDRQLTTRETCLCRNSPKYHTITGPSEVFGVMSFWSQFYLTTEQKARLADVEDSYQLQDKILTLLAKTISPADFFIFFSLLAKYQNLDLAVVLSGAKIRIWYNGGTRHLLVGYERPTILYSRNWKDILWSDH